MLILTRLPGQKIIIDTGHERIEVIIVQVRGDKVRVGIDAPKHVQIAREELLSEGPVLRRNTDESEK